MVWGSFYQFEELFVYLQLYCCTFKIYTFRNPNDIFYKPKPTKKNSKFYFHQFIYPQLNWNFLFKLNRTCQHISVRLLYHSNDRKATSNCPYRFKWKATIYSYYDIHSKCIDSQFFRWVNQKKQNIVINLLHFFFLKMMTNLRKKF